MRDRSAEHIAGYVRLGFCSAIAFGERSLIEEKDPASSQTVGVALPK